MKKNKTKKILTTLCLCLLTGTLGITTTKAAISNYTSYKSDYTKNDTNFTTNSRSDQYSLQKVSDWYQEGLSKYAIETREGQPYYMKGPADSEGLREHYGEIKDASGKVIGYRWYDLAWYILYADNGGNWMTHNIYGDSGDHYGIRPGATGNFYLAVNLDTVINKLQSKYGVNIVEKNVKIYGYEKFKTVYGKTSQNLLQAYGIPTVTEGTIDWANKKGNLSFKQFTTNSGNVYGMNSKYNYNPASASVGVRSHAYYIPYMIYILFNECEYTVADNFPTEGNTGNKDCCTYYETGENYKKIPAYIEGMTKEQALELLYKDYPACRQEQKCTIDLLPALSSTTNPPLKACCETLLTQYAGNTTAISKISKYCSSETASSSGKICTDRNYTVNVNTPNSCTESTTGTISDITDWKCIFDSTNQSSKSKYSTFYLVESTKKNPYCSVYCREDINYEFPTNNISVEAGKHFTINNKVSGIASWYPINFTSKRECRTTSSQVNKVHVQMDVDAGYKAYYDAIIAYENFMNNARANSGKYSNGYDSRGCQYKNCYSYRSCSTNSKTGKKRCRTRTTCSSTDCTTVNRLKSNLNQAKRSAKCTGLCDYDELTYGSNQYTIGYNYLVSGKINVEQFIKDWNKWNDKIDPNWEGWKINSQYAANAECESIEYKCPYDCECETDEEGHTHCKTCYSEHTGQSCKTYAYYDSNDDGDAEKKTASGRDSCHGEVPDWAGRARDYRDKYREAVEKRKEAEDYIWACNDLERFKEVGTSSSLTSSKYAYSGSFSQFLKYDKFSPDLTLNYNNSEWIYHYNDLLDKKLVNQDLDIDTTYYKFATAESAGYTYGASINEIFKNKWQIDRGEEYPLGQVEYIYPINEESRTEILKEYTYKLPSDQYQYILKPQGLSVSEKPDDEDQEYINLGYTNLPVHFMTPEGSYPITLTYNQFSSNERLEHKFDDIVFGTDRNKSLVYNCNYFVDNNIIDNPGGGETTPNSCEEKCGSDTVCLADCKKCEENCAGDRDCMKSKCYGENPNDPTSPGADALACIQRCNGDQTCIENCSSCEGAQCVTCTGDYCDDWRGLAIIYRPISLENPFPGIDGEIREPGSNWKSTKVKVDGETKYLYISSNRNVSGSEIYHANVRPMYSFTLTPSVIMKIRAYNDTTDYGDFNMKCIKSSDGVWKECKSNFLRNQAGTGTNWQVQIGNNRPKTWVDWDTCGMHDNWEACTLEDEERS